MARLKIEVNVPQSHLDVVRAAMHGAGAGAGHIAGYDQCSTAWPVMGSWRPGIDSQPVVGEPGRFEVAEEWRLDSICDESDAAAVLDAVRAAHPYEEPLIIFLPTVEPDVASASSPAGARVRPDVSAQR